MPAWDVAARTAAGLTGDAGGRDDAAALLIFALAHCPEAQVGARPPAWQAGSACRMSPQAHNPGMCLIAL